MAYCSSCGVKVLADATFCGQCGKPVSDQTENININEINVLSEPQATQPSSSQNQKEALKYANQAILVFIYMFFCDVKGSDPSSGQEIGTTIAIYLALMGVIYFCVEIQGIKKSKPNFVLIPTIVLAILYLLGLVAGSDMASNNFYDWFSYILALVQVCALGYVYSLIKPR